jgi:cysteinyl-tRNA synthetase
MAVLFELAKELRKAGNIITHAGQAERDPQSLRDEWQTLVVLSQVLGLEVPRIAISGQLAGAPGRIDGTLEAGLTSAEIEDLIAQRKEARKAKNWAESDRIRDELKAQGVALIDKPGGVTEWHRG